MLSQNLATLDSEEFKTVLTTVVSTRTSHEYYEICSIRREYWKSNFHSEFNWCMLVWGKIVWNREFPGKSRKLLKGKKENFLTFINPPSNCWVYCSFLSAEERFQFSIIFFFFKFENTFEHRGKMRKMSLRKVFIELKIDWFLHSIQFTDVQHIDTVSKIVGAKNWNFKLNQSYETMKRCSNSSSWVLSLSNF